MAAAAAVKNLLQAHSSPQRRLPRWPRSAGASLTFFAAYSTDAAVIDLADAAPPSQAPQSKATPASPVPSTGTLIDAYRLVLMVCRSISRTL